MLGNIFSLTNIQWSKSEYRELSSRPFMGFIVKISGTKSMCSTYLAKHRLIDCGRPIRDSQLRFLSRTGFATPPLTFSVFRNTSKPFKWDNMPQATLKVLYSLLLDISCDVARRKLEFTALRILDSTAFHQGDLL